MEAPEDWPVIMRVLIGSHAHGLAREDSDRDVREVFVIPTQRLLAVGHPKVKDAWTSQHRMADDLAGWEVGKLLGMAMHGHPNSVEVFYAPSEGESHPLDHTNAALAVELRALAPIIVPRNEFVRGVLGYSRNCITKLYADDRPEKWSTTYLRILYAALGMLTEARFYTNVDDDFSIEAAEILREARDGELSKGWVIDKGEGLESKIAKFLETDTVCALPDVPDLAAANAWLSSVRKIFWEWTP